MAPLAIQDHGLIGDLYTAALVGRDGSIDWFCAPRFDSASVFAALLDAERGGHWRIAPLAPVTSEQRYLPGTNVLVTTFHAEAGGVVSLTDFMPVGPAREGGTSIYRHVVCQRGELTVAVEFAPRFDYARQAPQLIRRESGILATDRDDDVLTVAGPPGVAWELADGVARATLTLRAGDEAWFVLRWDDDEVHAIADYRAAQTFEATTRWWDAWVAQLQYHGPYRQEVERSALALKLCSYEPSGAILAAPTTSLPEWLGGDRNWDYRFTWLRDSAFVLYALDLLGFDAEGGQFMRFLKRVARRKDGSHLQIMYGVDGRRELPERTLEHLAGYHGSRPVRVGNAAAGQFQMDVYGELFAAARVSQRRHPTTEGLWHTLRELADWTASHWRQPDLSIWEPRNEPRHYVYSKVLAWVALDRAVIMARELGRSDDVALWEREAAAVRAEVLERGWDPMRRTFVQAYGEPQLDAALLAIPKFRFLPRGDPRVRDTLAAVRRELATSCEDLVYRYRAPDGVGGDEGAFVVCSFWMVQNLAMVGEIDEAERLFKLLLRRASPVGLFAEEIDPRTGDHLGNYPLALSHAALINTAYILERLRGRPAPGPPD